MESKAKPQKTEKKESAPPLKPEPTPAAPAAEEKQAEDGAGNQEGAQEGSEGAGGCCETLENLKPFLIGGAVVALGAIIVGVVLLAKKK
ncbi:cell cycle exit and neuronal differentiation protein 1-like [Trichomycterus rosablanca]|uniref:cell cycle exit and neuronal differentiation protein 1-like n=1 Tax=Trichomycterus rosablanca TaxID=2290929 RepID=UPI002F35D096